MAVGTCIAPLLSMKLANGRKLVSLVCPGALLQMSRNALWSFFARVVQKVVYTYTFQRGSCNDKTDAEPLLRKLQMARTQKAVVVSTPTAIKSTFLKYLELIQQKKMDVAHVLVQIFELWGKPEDDTKGGEQGVLILDEVDAILHPLKSELNFPIGAQRDLEM